jgi:glycerol dehydrogenase-like iron-containing ADH family enzyme
MRGALKEMNTMKLPQYTIGEKSLSLIGSLCREHGSRVLVIGGRTALEKTREFVEASLKSSGIDSLDFAWYGGECTYGNIQSLSERVLDGQANVIIGIGGGKALDTAKVVAEKASLPLITVPTIASTCAAATLLSVIYTEQGYYDSIFLLNNPPVHILIDTEIIAKAPSRYLWAGIGDTISKYYEVEITTRGKRLNHSAAMGKALSVMCVDPLIQYGVKALESNERGETSVELEEVVLNIIITTGIVSMVVGEEYASACAHGLFNGLTILEQIEKHHLHGEVVAYGVLVLLMMDGQMEELKRLYGFYKSIKLPTSLEDIEVKNDKQYLDPVLDKAVRTEDVAKMPYKVTKDMFLEAIDKLERGI